MNRCVIFSLFLGFSALGAGMPFQVSLLENDILHVQASDVTSNFTQELEVAAPTNKISGTVLDLRFADGNKVSGVDYFADQKTPLVILVNGETRGAAAVLAEQLHSAHKAILIGSTNPPGVVIPDIAVAVTSNDEKAFQNNPYIQLPSDDSATTASSNDFLPFVDHTSEADLVRRRVKDGDDEDMNAPEPASSKPQPAVIHDPELARAVDLLKAISILRPAHG
ncbi:MAG TPA: hypothetical protein VFF11_12565 [Candidatus Binatia bacterium]|nr:hypothetical protein [Candidatus Binatia bacterium]